LASGPRVALMIGVVDSNQRWSNRVGPLLAAFCVLALVVLAGVSGLNEARAKVPMRPVAYLASAPAMGAFGLDLMHAQGPGNLVLKGPSEFAGVGDLQRAIVAGQEAAAEGDPEAVLRQKGVDVKPFLNDDGSGGLYVSSPVGLGSGPWSWETCSPDLTSCAPFATGEEINTGRAAPETVFRISGDGRVGVSPLWHGNLSVAAPPSVTGFVRANELVTPVPAIWTGGWDGDLDQTQLAACATPAGERCISLTDAKYVAPCSHEAAVLDRAFTGKYLRVASRRFGLGEGSTLEGHSSPFGDEIWSPDGRTAAAVVGRIEPATGPRTVRCGPPPLIVASISRYGVAKVACAIRCRAVLVAEKGGRRGRLGRRLGRSLYWSREQAKLRLPPRALELLGPGPAQMTVEINGEKITERMVRLRSASAHQRL
jgi:hypothetical protein